MITPYKNKSEGKKKQVAEMFNNISEKYDFLNHFLSIGTDILWRKKAIKLLKPYKPQIILDLATGTGDFAFEALNLQPQKIAAADISEGMLAQARQKRVKSDPNNKIEFLLDDAENLSFADQTFDAATIAFGIRNFENLEKGISELSRVLKPGAPAAIMEFSKPEKFPVKQAYFFYFNRILPLLGRIISSDQSAYHYLPESVKHFPYGNEMCNILIKNGFKKVKLYPLSGGIATIYLAEK